jgi:hypothetical protein
MRPLPEMDTNEVRYCNCMCGIVAKDNRLRREAVVCPNGAKTEYR